MNILVTGASGYLGFNLVKRLLKDGFTVYALTRTDFDFSHARLEVVKCDLVDINSMLEGVSIDVVFHTAARVNFDESLASLSQLTQDNIISTLELANFILIRGIKKVIYSSSCSVYEEKYNHDELTSEDSRLRPRNTYAVSKLSSEWILENKLKNSNIGLVVLRYSSIYGYRQRANSIVPILINRAINHADLNIFGSGNRIQDYVYIDDVVDANIKCLDPKLQFNTILNIGSGEPISDLQLAEHIKSNWNNLSTVQILNTNIERETYLNYDIGKAREVLGYHPLNLKDGLLKYKLSQEL